MTDEQRLVVQASGLHLRETDLAILAALIEGRFLTTALVADEFFSHRNAANRRLKQLEAAGYLARDRRGVTEDAIWRPTKLAVRVLIERGRLDPTEAAWSWKQSQSSITYKEHEADVNRFRLALLRRAAEHEEVTVTRCASGPVLYDAIRDRDGTRYPVRPDRFLELTVEKTILHYFLEVDRGNRDLKSTHKRDVGDQLFAYSVYYVQGGFLRKYGNPRDPVEAWPFRVLVTAPTAARRNNIIERMIEQMACHGLPPSSMRGYAIFNEALADPFGAIWLREIEVSKILQWLERQPIDQAIGAAIPEATFPDVRAALGAELLLRSYRRTRAGATDPREPPVRDLELRDVLLDALIRTGRLQRFSILEGSWRSQS